MSKLSSLILAPCTHPLKHFVLLVLKSPILVTADQISLTHTDQRGTPLCSVCWLCSHWCSTWLLFSAAQQYWCRASNMEERAQSSSTKQVLHLFITMWDHFCSLPEGWLLPLTRRKSEWERSTNQRMLTTFELRFKTRLVSKLHLIIYALICHSLMQHNVCLPSVPNEPQIFLTNVCERCWMPWVRDVLSWIWQTQISQTKINLWCTCFTFGGSHQQQNVCLHGSVQFWEIQLHFVRLWTLRGRSNHESIRNYAISLFI